MKPMILSIALLLAPAAHALDATCELYLAAAEKSAKQPARHAVTDGGGMRSEAVVLDGKFYVQAGGKWRLMKVDFTAIELKLVNDVRAGKIPISDCKVLGSESIEGAPMSVVSYTMKMQGLPAASAKAYIGKDGLVYAQSSEDSKIRYRYTGVQAPAL
ncbi:hypothetical protein [Steroidobacter sp.]|uniref:hypothetical protein n=1 Tax=Steroidobacter sp. TaxID=1978227 RepID=UPI001A432CF0|nr:hypothetical protein [Steroidobacter sp.]MBL8269669.1 hypothetical protein [Steroidobacter sp.]